LSSISLPNQPLHAALVTCQAALRRIAGYVLDPALDELLRALGERKEFLSAAEHAELMALVAFTQRRTLEKLEAELALQRLHAAYPELAGEP
jgi:hypothetical protein